jgi:hypothetical protein
MTSAVIAPLPDSSGKPLRAVAERVWSDPRLRDGRTHVVVGGSCVSGLATPTSDVDLFVISDDPETTSLGRFGPASSVDIESRSISWFEATVERLRVHELNVGGVLPPFSFQDLRFLTRLRLGLPLVRRAGIDAALPSIENALRLTLAQYYSAVYVNQYQDAFGFYLAHMYDSVLLSAGPLLQASILLAQLQERLVDPAPKWAVPSALQSSDAAVRDEVRRGLNLVQQFDRSRGSMDTLALLNHVNAIVARTTFGTVWSEKVTAQCERSEDATKALARPHFEHPNKCPMGLPGYPLLVDVVNRCIEIASAEFMLVIAKRGIAEDRSVFSASRLGSREV